MKTSTFTPVRKLYGRIEVPLQGEYMFSIANSES
jgi:hypothetical protein